jgi:hypothetical protein
MGTYVDRELQCAESNFSEGGTMLRTTLVLSAVLLAAGLALSVSLIAADARPKVLSEGSLAPSPQVFDPGEASPAYSQVVDNADPNRFAAPLGWDTLWGNVRAYGEDYRYVEAPSGKKTARFRVTIPEQDFYTVYARWPAGPANSAAVRFGISTVSGLEWTEVNQQTDGGIWVRLGAYEMAAGDRYAVRVSGNTALPGAVVADAILVVRGTQENPEEGAGDTARAGAGGSGYATGYDVVRAARNHIGTPYRLSPPRPCRAFVAEDCACHTKLVFAGFGWYLPDNPVQQWRYGRYVAPGTLRLGDLVFFKEAGRNRPITHVGIYSGNGNLIHASSYWGKVVERPMHYINGYYGARRLI